MHDMTAEDRRRSIPAPAGEPGGLRLLRRGPRVYPRACGGTAAEPPAPVLPGGLSPRLRGNPHDCSCEPCKTGSIPAPAGEPLSGHPALGLTRVYPRACGGTFLETCPLATPSGLSPRLRGNHRKPHGIGGKRRSIPAPAGEPRSTILPSTAREVYPRACGGTGNHCAMPTGVGGLSPRLRGNLFQQRRHLRSQGSIPAPAGEPSCGASNGRHRMVYPRACGGTSKK